MNKLLQFIIVKLGLYRNPTKAEMINSYLDVVAVGKSKEYEVCACFSINKDPTYIHSVTSVVEVALTMILESDKLNDHTGVITPAILNDSSKVATPKEGVLFNRLIQHHDFDFKFLYHKPTCTNNPTGETLQNFEHHQTPHSTTKND
jgi:hypothetical protein